MEIADPQKATIYEAYSEDEVNASRVENLITQAKKLKVLTHDQNPASRNS